MSLEGIISKRADAPYCPGDRGLWVKVKCQNREEFVVVGWTDPEGSRPWLGALLLAYYDLDGRLVYAGRVGTGIGQAELGRLWHRLQPLATSEIPLDKPLPRTNRFGSPLVLSRRCGVGLSMRSTSSRTQYLLDRCTECLSKARI